MALSKNVDAIIRSEQDLDRRVEGERNAFEWRQSISHITNLCFEKCFNGRFITPRSIARAKNCGRLYKETSDYVTELLLDLQDVSV
ncbi:Tiny Tim (Tim8/Tim9/Tim10/Tim13) [Carpediemonas membranifera]|uniref:Tiny Tim (Tim8/Tim9/Tim10/Tim13) n=1 Tax=Carpediemonas membranifera TaxID=201153 RepID=A0A8J6AQQ8_9EUKA|nr:Tiny Tim (Tim8/Tim9/Tim10/Tim13) [Carpediemonas membranifera]|eukprot:KAG9391771.1 Tiny Tim (Tim8/Tim9/Tim10/Tim13) [Carpediemonas membranifera]